MKRQAESERSDRLHVSDVPLHARHVTPRRSTCLLWMLGSTDSGGGLAHMLERFRQAGLGNVVATWVGTGENAPVSAEQVEQGFGTGVVRLLAQSTSSSNNRYVALQATAVRAAARS